MATATSRDAAGTRLGSDRMGSAPEAQPSTCGVPAGPNTAIGGAGRGVWCRASQSNAIPAPTNPDRKGLLLVPVRVPRVLSCGRRRRMWLAQRTRVRVLVPAALGGAGRGYFISWHRSSAVDKQVVPKAEGHATTNWCAPSWPWPPCWPAPLPRSSVGSCLYLPRCLRRAGETPPSSTSFTPRLHSSPSSERNLNKKKVWTGRPRAGRGKGRCVMTAPCVSHRPQPRRWVGRDWLGSDDTVIVP